MNSQANQHSTVRLTFSTETAPLVHAYSTRALGNMSVSRDLPSDVLQHRRHFCEILSVPYERTFLIPQTHSTNILVVADDRILDQLSSVRLYRGGGPVIRGAGRKGTVCRSDEWEQGIDGVIWRDTNLYAMVTTADCAPIGFWHEPTATMGLAHAGLIGAINQLPAKMIGTLCAQTGGSPDQVQVTIAPCIRGCHYDLSHSGVWKEIGDTVLSFYGRDNEYFERGFFDLSGFIKAQLMTAGVPAGNINDSGRCTVCDHSTLYSNFAAGDPQAKAKEGRFSTLLGLNRQP